MLSLSFANKFNTLKQDLKNLLTKAILGNRRNEEVDDQQQVLPTCKTHISVTILYSDSVLQTGSFTLSWREQSDNAGSSEIGTEDCMYESHGASEVYTESRPVVMAKQKQERYGRMLHWRIAALPFVWLCGLKCHNRSIFLLVQHPRL